MLIFRNMTTFDLCVLFFVMCHLSSKSSYGFEDDTLKKGMTCGLPINPTSANLQWKRNKWKASFIVKKPRQCDESKLFSQREMESKMNPSFSALHL